MRKAWKERLLSLTCSLPSALPHLSLSLQRCSPPGPAGPAALRYQASDWKSPEP